MALTARQKGGIALLVSGALFLVAGVAVLATSVTPAWVGLVIAGVGTVCEVVLGIVIVKPSV